MKKIILENSYKKHMKSFQSGEVTFQFNVESIYTKYKFDIDEYVNAPDFVSLYFKNYDEYYKRAKKLFEGFEDFTQYGVYEVAGECRCSFKAPSKERCDEWYHTNFRKLAQEQAVEFFELYGYMPYNFKGYFVDAHVGDCVIVPKEYKLYRKKATIPAYEPKELHGEVVEITGFTAKVKFDDFYDIFGKNILKFDISSFFNYKEFMRKYTPDLYESYAIEEARRQETFSKIEIECKSLVDDMLQKVANIRSENDLLDLNNQTFEFSTGLNDEQIEAYMTCFTADSRIKEINPAVIRENDSFPKQVTFTFTEESIQNISMAPIRRAKSR